MSIFCLYTICLPTVLTKLWRYEKSDMCNQKNLRPRLAWLGFGRNHEKNWLRLKIHHLDPKIFNSDKDLLINSIKDKNQILNFDDIEDILVPFVDETNKFVILKVSIFAHSKIFKNQRIYIELEACHVSDHFSAIWYGANSTHCPLKEAEINVCLYCAKNHGSASCLSKKTKTKI